MRKRLVERAPPDGGKLRSAMRNANTHMDYMDYLLDHRSWLGGAMLSLADIAAAAHLAPAVEWVDLDGNLLITDDPFVAVPVERGRFVFSDRPGLGALPRP